jgi:hypothetical protein
VARIGYNGFLFPHEYSGEGQVFPHEYSGEGRGGLQMSTRAEKETRYIQYGQNLLFQ